jgi:hypothetical protein
MGELECILPDELKNGGIASGDELVLPYAEALAAILIATNHQIARSMASAGAQGCRGFARSLDLGEGVADFLYVGDDGDVVVLERGDLAVAIHDGDSASGEWRTVSRPVPDIVSFKDPRCDTDTWAPDITT